MSDCDCPEIKCDEGIPAWVMTFADLMSLLLAFFVLLFSFSEMDKNVYKELAGSLKDAFGVQREIKAKETPRGINIIAREFSPGRPTPTALNEVRQVTTNESKLHAVFTDAAKNGQENQNKKADDAQDKSFNAMMDDTADNDNKSAALDEKLVKRLTELKQVTLAKIQADAEAIREELKEEIKNGIIEVDVKDERIILRIREKGSFLSGSADLIEPFNAVTGKIGKVFNDFDGMIIVSGHTDSVPIKTGRFRSNWELSSSRAVSVIHALATNSVLTQKRFEIAAFADTKPVDSNDTYLGRSKNRRVEIMLDYSKDPSVLEILNTEKGGYAFNPLLQKVEATSEELVEYTQPEMLETSVAKPIEYTQPEMSETLPAEFIEYTQPEMRETLPTEPIKYTQPEIIQTSPVEPSEYTRPVIDIGQVSAQAILLSE